MKNKNTDFKVLIAEDDQKISELLKIYLKKLNYSTTCVPDGVSAYNELKKNVYDVCLLDLNLPEKSGVEILRDLYNKKHITTAIIVLTGNINTSIIIKVMKLGAYNYIQKPCNFDIIKLAVEQAFGHKILKQENIKYKYFLEREVKKKTKQIERSYLYIVNCRLFYAF